MFICNFEILSAVVPEKSLMKNFIVEKELETCQYDTDTPAQGHPHPHTGILQKMKLKKGQ